VSILLKQPLFVLLYLPETDFIISFFIFACRPVAENRDADYLVQLFRNPGNPGFADLLKEILQSYSW